MGIDESSEKSKYEEKFYAYRIYKIYNKSPLKSYDIKELSDFILPPKEIYERKITIKQYIDEKINQKVKLKIFSLSTRKAIEVEIIVNKNENKDEIFECLVNYENINTAHFKLLHIMEIKKGSFSHENLLLTENLDYLIGIRTLNDGIFYSINNDAFTELIACFINILNQNKGKECEFYIFNSKRGAKLITTKIPNNNNFSLGCDVAYGKAHEFPIKAQERDDELQILKE